MYTTDLEQIDEIKFVRKEIIACFDWELNQDLFAVQAGEPTTRDQHVSCKTRFECNE